MNNKYANNYDYHKAIWLLNRDDLIENGFLLVKEDDQWVSPVGSLFIERYDEIDQIVNKLADYQGRLQLVTSRAGAKQFKSALSKQSPTIAQTDLGSAQSPALDDYADGVDAIEFLLDLK
jgi:hypothetical protein